MHQKKKMNKSIWISMLVAAGLMAQEAKTGAKPEAGKSEKALGTVGKGVDKAATATVEGTKTAAEATGRGAKKAGTATVRGVKRAAKATETGARKATAVTGEGLSKAGETMKKADPKKDKEGTTVKK
jgi:hypothetical protein